MKLSAYARAIGISYYTAWRWFKAGRIKGYQVDTGTVIVTEPIPQEPPVPKMKVVVYARVSAKEFKDNLESQAQRLVSYCAAKGYQLSAVIKEIGSGVNDTRPKFLKMLTDPTITVIVVEHKDRLTRFGFTCMASLLQMQGRRIEVINEAENGKEDIQEDFVSIITSFCARLYGQRRSKRRTEKIIASFLTMRLVERHLINRHHDLYDEIDALCFRSKNLYNLATYHQRQEFFQTGSAFSYEQLDSLLQGTDAYKALPAKVSQQVLRQVGQCWRSFFAAKKAFKEFPLKFTAPPRLPGYKPKQTGRNLIIYTAQALSRPGLRQGQIIPSLSTLLLPTKQLKVHQVRIVPRVNHYVIEVVYEREVMNLGLDKNNIAGIDIGLDNLAAVTSNTTGFTPLLINGRPLKAINSYYNRKKAFLQSTLHRSPPTSRRIQEVTHKRNCKVDSYLHHASKTVIKRLVEHNIGTLVIGHNPEWKQGIEMGKVNNQNFVSIPHARFIDQLTYKAQLVGIDVIETEESYTSKCSFLDGEPIQTHDVYQGKRVKRGLFRSANGTLINADINGSANIIRKAFPNAFADGIQAVVVRPVRVTPYKLAS